MLEEFSIIPAVRYDSATSAFLVIILMLRPTRVLRSITTTVIKIYPSNSTYHYSSHNFKTCSLISERGFLPSHLSFNLFTYFPEVWSADNFAYLWMLSSIWNAYDLKFWHAQNSYLDHLYWVLVKSVYRFTFNDITTSFYDEGVLSLSISWCISSRNSYTAYMLIKFYL